MLLTITTLTGELVLMDEFNDSFVFEVIAMYAGDNTAFYMANFTECLTMTTDQYVITLSDID